MTSRNWPKIWAEAALAEVNAPLTQEKLADLFEDAGKRGILQAREEILQVAKNAAAQGRPFDDETLGTILLAIELMTIPPAFQGKPS